VDPLGELTVLPESHSWIKGEKEGEVGKEVKERWKGRGGEKRRTREGEGLPPK